MEMSADSTSAPPAARTFRAFAWGVLAYSILVIVWGAVVRATGSGAGCGNHWPLCNGEVVPLAPRTATLIEFAHRASSGISVLLTIALVVWAWVVFPRRHRARAASLAAVVFILVEALFGYLIVEFHLVEQNASAMRAVVIAVHLVNTMLLVGAFTLAVSAAVPRRITWPADERRRWRRRMAIGLAAMMAVAAAGAVVALGDTLFPHETLAEGIMADFRPASSFLVRLRIWHPLLAGVTSFYLVGLVAKSDAFDEPALRVPARVAMACFAVQLALGIVNVLQMAPLALQLAHLFASNVLWVSLVWLWRGAEPDVSNTSS